jgi:tRNA(Ile)-lysidine synthase
MIKLLGKIPDKVVVACSGGPDSMAAVDFLNNGRRDLSIVHFNHGTSHSDNAEKIVSDYCEKNNINLSIHKITGNPSKGESLEMWWREKRYKVFHSIGDAVITAHNLNDIAEWWIFTSLRGNPKITPYRNKNVIRPFLITEKATLESWCKRHSVPFIIDPSNSGDRFSRSLIRKNIIPEAIRVNPGFLKTMSNKVRKNYKENLL